MRLLNARTYELHTVHTELGQEKPLYAILSHTWEEEEVLFEDIQQNSDSKWRAKKGSVKVKYTCEQALKDGYDYVWIDTCCINKDSGAELSEAINSMFTLYREASLCYAYLSDLNVEKNALLSQCRWFGRGWTLQELIAPDHVHFYDVTWAYLGSRTYLAPELSQLTGIQEDFLMRGHSDQRQSDWQCAGYTDPYYCQYCSCPKGPDVQEQLSQLSVAQRMKWASKRTTTRVEDTAYCLMGLFDVNMPLLYGEGMKAFRRLQQEIIRSSGDHSIFAFRAPDVNLAFNNVYSFLAPHPSFFRDDIQNDWTPVTGDTDIRLLGDEVSVNMLICPINPKHTSSPNLVGDHLGILDNVMSFDYLSRPALLLTKVDGSSDRFYLGNRDPVLLVLLPTDIQYLKNWKVLERRVQDPLRQGRYDPKDISRRRITLVDSRVVHSKAPTYIPFRLNLSPTMSSIIDSHAAIPDFIANSTSISTDNNCGMIFFYSIKFENFMIAWERDGPQNGPVVRGIWPLSSIQDERILELAARPQDKLDRAMVRKLLDSFLLDRSKRVQNEIVLGERHTNRVKIWALVSRVMFIGRTAFQLNLGGKFVS